VFQNTFPTSFPAAGASTEPNLHPGTELLLPLDGEATIHFTKAKEQRTVSAAKEELAHYSSELEHYVVNSSQDKSADLFVLRFYGDKHLK